MQAMPTKTEMGDGIAKFRQHAHLLQASTYSNQVLVLKVLILGENQNLTKGND